MIAVLIKFVKIKTKIVLGINKIFLMVLIFC